MRVLLTIGLVFLSTASTCFSLDFNWMESTRSSAFSNSIGGIIGVNHGPQAVFENPSLLPVSGTEVIGFGTESDLGRNIQSVGMGIGTTIGSFGIGVVQTSDKGVLSSFSNQEEDIGAVLSNKFVLGYSFQKPIPDGQVGVGVNLISYHYTSMLKNTQSIDVSIGGHYSHNGSQVSMVLEHVLGSTFESFFGKIETLHPTLILSGKQMYTWGAAYAQIELGNNHPLLSYGASFYLPFVPQLSVHAGNKNDAKIESSGLFSTRQNNYHAPSFGLRYTSEKQVFDYGVSIFDEGIFNHYFSTKFFI